MTGRLPFVTVTVRVVVAEFPAASVAVYVIVFVPTTFVSTVPVMTGVIGPSTVSLAVAPGSAYAVPKRCVIVDSPDNVIAGAVVSTTFTVRVTGTAELPDESVTLYLTVYVPGLTFDISSI